MASAHLRLRPTSFRAARSGASITGKRHPKRTGTTVRYTDTEASRTTFTVLRPVAGVRRGRRCVAPPKHHRKAHRLHRCTRLVKVGHVTRRDRHGANRFHFSGRVRRRMLPSGRYRLTAVPRSNGLTGRAVSARFRIVG